jgi:hypothetical protein
LFAGFGVASWCQVSKTMGVPDRTFVSMTGGGGRAGFSDATLQIEMLDPHAPVPMWYPSLAATRNLNGSFPALDCYTTPAACAASNAARMEAGLMSRDGWSVWDDHASPRMVPSATQNGYPQWFAKNNGRNASLTDADLYFFGHGLDFKAVMHDFLLLSGPPGMLSAADYGLWWSNSFVFTKEQFLNRLISNFSKHQLPFTHLVMDFGWHQQQAGRLWASYTWNQDLFGNTSQVQQFVQSLHSNAPSSPLGRSMARRLFILPSFCLAVVLLSCRRLFILPSFCLAVAFCCRCLLLPLPSVAVAFCCRCLLLPSSHCHECFFWGGLLAA